MVAIQQSYLRQNGQSIYGSQLPLGNDDSSAFCLDKAFSTYNSDSTMSRWTLRFLCLIVLASWMTALKIDAKLNNRYVAFQKKFRSLNLQEEQTFDMIQDAKTKRDKILRQNRQQQRTKRLFDHEARMSEELYELKQSSSNSEVSKLIEQRQNGITSSWVKQRQEALYQKIASLQFIAQEQSRKRVVEKYGPGPHRVKFEVLTGQNARTSGSFIVELAPIDLVPYSVNVFLDMTTHRLWDNTVFYHHSAQHHVIAAAPVNFGTFDPKGHHFEALGYERLGFPDYSSSYPHFQYTLGFSGNGPNFYINAIDNSGHHGPGGQDHHEISADADPCFGKIVSGHEVVRRMIPDRSASLRPNAWEDYDLTRIVSVRPIIGSDN